MTYALALFALIAAASCVVCLLACLHWFQMRARLNFYKQMTGQTPEYSSYWEDATGVWRKPMPPRDSRGRFVKRG